MAEIYVSVDVESDGPIPAANSMLSFGAAAFRAGNRTPIGTFEANLELLPDAKPDADTMAWWKGQPEAWAECRANPQRPEDTMLKFKAWLLGLPGKPVFVGYPATYDFMFVYFYLIKFTGFPSPFGFQGLDLKTMAMTILGTDFRGTSKKTMPRHWFDGAPRHTHKALDDAIGQGVLFINMLNDRKLSS